LARQAPRGASYSLIAQGQCFQSNWFQNQFTSAANAGTPGAPGASHSPSHNANVANQLVPKPVHLQRPTLAQTTGASASKPPAALSGQRWHSRRLAALRTHHHPRPMLPKAYWFQNQFTFSGQRWHKQLAPAAADLPRDQWPALALAPGTPGASYSPSPRPMLPIQLVPKPVRLHRLTLARVTGSKTSSRYAQWPRWHEQLAPAPVNLPRDQ
jgi:hypothetical protein